MPTLTPELAAKIASGAYKIKNHTMLQAVQAHTPAELGLGGANGFEGQGRFKGLSCFEYSGFGFIAIGQGAFENDLLIAMRGTDKWQDWATDAMAWPNPATRNGLTTHLGFAGVFDTTLRNRVRASIEAYSDCNGRPPRCVHCVGHSLGGALATLTAYYVRKSYQLPVRLYTFGSPRTVDQNSAIEVTRRIGANNIYRVYHKADPVAMIPIFPFWHVPTQSESDDNPGYLLPGPGTFLSGEAHRMDTYKVSVNGVTNWAQLAANGAQTMKTFRQMDEVDSWLYRQGLSASPFHTMGCAAIWGIGKMLKWILREAEKRGLTLRRIGATIVDAIAQVLHSGIRIAGELSRIALGWIRRVMRFLGMVVRTVKDITLNFLRYMLQRLGAALNTAAQQALTAVNRVATGLSQISHEVTGLFSSWQAL